MNSGTPSVCSNLVHYILRECFAAGQPQDQRCAVAFAEARERDGRQVRVTRPRLRKLGSSSHE